MPINLHPQYITDNNGDKVSVVISMEEFKNIFIKGRNFGCNKK